MVRKKFKYDDLVWAKMRGHPYWPAKIDHAPQIKKGSHYVFFFGSRNHAWIADEYIEPHSKERLDNAPKRLTATMQEAIYKIVRLAAIKEVSEALTPTKKRQYAEIQTETSPRLAAMKDSVPINASLMPSRCVKRVWKERKRIAGKFVSEKQLLDAELGSSPSKLIKMANDANTHPHSRVAVIPPYDEVPRNEDVIPLDDSKATQTSNIPPYDEEPRNEDVIPLDDSKATQTSNDSSTLDIQEIGRKDTKKKIGFLGLGRMGQAIVTNMLKKGFDVTVWNRSHEKCVPFCEAGASTAKTPADVVAGCDITFGCFSDAEVTKTVMHSIYGVLKGFEGCVPGTKGYVEMTSVDPGTSAELAEAVRLAGGRYLEAPFLGGRQLVEPRLLSIFAAGDKELFDECQTAFGAFAQKIYDLGYEVGSASKMNLVLSSFMGTTYAALAEAVNFASRCGLPPTILLSVLHPFGMTEKGLAMFKSDFTPDTTLKNQQSHLNLALHLASAVNQNLPLAASANEIFRQAVMMHYGELDVSALIKFL